MTTRIELTEAARAEIVAAIEAADLESPEQVADMCIDAAEQGRDWRAVLDKCVENESPRGEAYHTGAAAADAGEPRTANPYCSGTYDSDEWFAGWDAA